MKKLLITSILLLVSSLAHSQEYKNSCNFTFEKGVYSITQYCKMNFYNGETLLTYGDALIAETAACTYDRDIGPMGYEEADEVFAEVYSKVFDENNMPRISANFDFREVDNGLDTFMSLTLDGVEEGGEIFLEEASDKVFPIGAMTINLNTPPIMEFAADDALVFHMNGDCSGPYFEASENPVNKHIKTCTSLGFTKGTEKHGDCVMKLLG
jgi:hypothetical protein